MFGVWSVFDAVKPFRFPPPSPDDLMAQIDAVIAASEYVRSTAALIKEEKHTTLSPPPSPPQSPARSFVEIQVYDKRIADDAYKAACSALAAGRPDAAIRSLHVAIESCPPDKTAAVKKIRSLLEIAFAQLNKQT